MMTHTLSFRSKHKSIKHFNEVKLPDFCLVTGVNGSGKSHLLESLAEAHIKSCCVDNTAQVAIFTWATLAPDDQPPSNPGQLSDLGKSILEKLKQFCQKNQRKNLLWHNPAGREKVTSDKLIDMISTASDAEKSLIISQIKNVLRSHIQKKGIEIYLGAIDNQKWSEKTPRLFGTDDVERENALRELDVVLTQGFEQRLNQTFQKYIDAENFNIFHRGKGNTNKSVDLPEQTPWDFLNKLFENANISFTIDAPELSNFYSKISVSLRKKGTDTKIKFKELSSGEKIFVSFTIALYNTEKMKQNATFPNLLLLDEIDATLHPSMVKYVLGVIKKTLVEEKNIKVIMTTHSPTTVALVDDDEVYEMDNIAGALTEIGRKKALGILTQDIPTLEVNYDARILVVTEDGSDAELWEKIYNNFADDQDFDRALVFLGSGVKTEQGTVGAGCDRVKKIVGKMREATLPRVIGLVDWDGKNDSKPDQKIHVLCEGERYAVENLLLDPVLCIYLMCKKHRDMAEKFEYLAANESDRELDDFDVDRWHEMINKFCHAVLKGEDISERVSISYACGKSLSIPKAYLQKNGHDLQAAIIKAYPCFKSLDRQGGMLLEIARAVSVGDFGKFYPQSITDTLKALVNLSNDTEDDRSL